MIVCFVLFEPKIAMGIIVQIHILYQVPDIPLNITALSAIRKD